MPRITQAVAAGYLHHVVQRGNNRGKVFFDDEDIGNYLDLLKKYSTKWDIRLFAYCLMTNHVHLLVKPKEGKQLHV